MCILPWVRACMSACMLEWVLACLPLSVIHFLSVCLLLNTFVFIFVQSRLPPPAEMSSLRSSVRPASSKQPWGTILQPEFGLGHQKMTAYEVDQTVSRLYYVPEQRETIHEKREQKPMRKKDIDEMVSERASERAIERVSE